MNDYLKVERETYSTVYTQVSNETWYAAECPMLMKTGDCVYHTVTETLMENILNPMNVILNGFVHVLIDDL